MNRNEIPNEMREQIISLIELKLAEVVDKARKTFAIDLLKSIKREFPVQYAAAFVKFQSDNSDTLMSEMKDEGMNTGRMKDVMNHIALIEASIHVTKETRKEFEAHLRDVAAETVDSMMPDNL